MRASFSVALVFAAAIRTAAAQIAPLTADSIGPKIDHLFARFDRTDSPGCAVGVGLNGQEVGRLPPDLYSRRV